MRRTTFGEPEASAASRSTVGMTCKLRLLAVSSLVGLSGCSLMFVDGPPSAHASMQSFSCDESRVWPVIDGGFAALSAISMLTAETKVDTIYSLFGFGGYDTSTSHKSEQIAAGALGLVVHGTSAVIGFRRVQQCRRAYAELRERLTTQTIRYRAGHPGSDVGHSVVRLRPGPVGSPSSSW
jgi:hypothetical protein